MMRLSVPSSSVSPKQNEQGESSSQLLLTGVVGFCFLQAMANKMTAAEVAIGVKSFLFISSILRCSFNREQKRVFAAWEKKLFLKKAWKCIIHVVV